MEESYLESMVKQWKAQEHEESELWSLKVLYHNQSGMQGGEVKRESTLKHSWWQSFQPLLEYFLKSNLCMLYVVSKIGKSTIQCFKRFANQSWNEEVRANGSRSLQAEGQFRRAAKSAFGCEINLRLRNDFAAILFVCEISQPFCAPAKFSWVLPVICDHRFLLFCLRYLLSKCQFSPCNPPIRWFLSCWARMQG